MATDYSKLKNAELEALLKERNLPHHGKKADMVSRLQESDKERAALNSTAAKPKPDSPVKQAARPAAKASTEPAAAAVAAGGQERVKNPQAVPKQAPAVDPATTSDLKVASTEETAATTPAVDFSSHLPATSIEAELEKRKARAKKFGIQESDADAIKALERAKRFGTGTAADGAAANIGVARLDQALPERRGKKRGSDAGLVDDYEDPALKRRRGGGAVRGHGAGRGGSGPRDAANKSNPSGGGSWMSEKDREAAEKRKARWASTTPAATSTS